MSGSVTITPGKQFAPGELQTRAGLNQLGTPVGQVDEGAITEREIDPASVRRILGIMGNNLFCNGNFAYWPSEDDISGVASLTGVVSGGRKHDYAALARWVIANDANRTISRQAFTPGQMEVPGAPFYFARWAQSSPVAGTINPAYFGQRLEKVANYSGRTFTFVIWVRSNVGVNIIPSMRQMFGDALAGSPSADVVTDKTAVQLAPDVWTKVSATWLVPSVAGKNIVEGTTPANVGSFTEFRIVVPQGIVFTMDFAQAQLVEGDQELLFEARPAAIDYAEAQRYRQSIGIVLSDNLATHGSPFANMPVKPRVKIGTGNITLFPLSGTGGVVSADAVTANNLIQTNAHSAIAQARIFVDCELHAPA